MKEGKPQDKNDAMDQLAKDFRALAGNTPDDLADMPPIKSPVLGDTLYVIIQTLCQQTTDVLDELKDRDTKIVALEKRVESAEKVVSILLQRMSKHKHDAVGAPVMPMEP